MNTDGGLPIAIILISIAVALLAFIFGAIWMRKRREAARHGHLEVDMARPETLDDLNR